MERFSIKSEATKSTVLWELTRSSWVSIDTSRLPRPQTAHAEKIL